MIHVVGFHHFVSIFISYLFIRHTPSTEYYVPVVPATCVKVKNIKTADSENGIKVLSKSAWQITFCDFLFASLHTKLLLKRVCHIRKKNSSQGEQILSF